MKTNFTVIAAFFSLLTASSAQRMGAQAPEGPIAPTAGAAVQQPPPEPQAKLKVQVALVNTPVTVRDSKGQMNHNLDAKDFLITDNGVPQKITHFDLGGDPVSLVILMETSVRIAPMIPVMRKTGIIFTQTVMGQGGEAAVVTFNDSIDKLQDFTSNNDAIEKTIAQINPGTSGTKLYDAMAVGVEMLTDRPQATAETPGRRRVLMLVSEANDFGSAAKLGEVLRKAQLANVTIYCVGLSTTRAELQEKPNKKHIDATPPGVYGSPPFPGSVQTPTSEETREESAIDLLALAVYVIQHAQNAVRDHALEVAAAATGGTHLSTFKDRSIEKAIDEIGGELHSQYSLSYTPTGSNDFGYHEIKVNVDRKGTKGLKVRARPGYYIATPGA
jgi:VWFA-related protein